MNTRNTRNTRQIIFQAPGGAPEGPATWPVPQTPVLPKLRTLLLGFISCAALSLLLPPVASAQDAPANPIAELNQVIAGAGDAAASPARQRLAVRRVIRDAEQLLATQKDTPARFATLEFLFRARKQLVALDDDKAHREALLETCRELIQAPNEMAGLRVEADFLLSLAEQARNGGQDGRAETLRQFVARYIGTPAGTKSIRAAMLMALELGDSTLTADILEVFSEHHSNDLEMIAFMREHLGGQVFGVPFAGHFQRSDGKMARYPMDTLGHTSLVLFWSLDNERILPYLVNLAAAYKLDQPNIGGRMEIISVNLDELPDAGESIKRRIGADWTCLHLPGGRNSPIYKAYARTDFLTQRVAPTGQVAMVTHDFGRGATGAPKRVRLTPEEIEQALRQIKPAADLSGIIDNFRRTIIRGWSRSDYAMNLNSLATGDFLIFDPEGPMDPRLPPELKATGANPTPLTRTPQSVPAETLAAIQNSLVAPPHRYHAPIDEIRTGYRNMVDLSRKAIAAHPDAPDLWIVRNRLITGLLGLWKSEFKLEHFEAAVAAATLAMEAGFPDGTDIIARFCLARHALRDPKADVAAVIDPFIARYGGAAAPGPAHAAACLLALDVGDAKRFNDHREAILTGHPENPMMWIFSGFLSDPYHRYWLFQVPFTAGWTFDRREKYEMHKGAVEEGRRMIRAELPTADGKVFRIPGDLQAEYTAIFFTQPPPWKGQDREDPKPLSPSEMLRGFPSFVNARPDVNLMLAIYGDAADEAIRAHIDENRARWQGIEIPVLRVPGGVNHPLVHRLGLLSGKEAGILIDKQGRILSARSGVSYSGVHPAIENTVMWLDEQKVSEALARGDIDAAKQLILTLAPPYDPEARDARGRPRPVPRYSLYHLRARARVYLALKEWDKALADAELVVQQLLGDAGGLSLRTQELDESEALRDQIRKLMTTNPSPPSP